MAAWYQRSDADKEASMFRKDLGELEDRIVARLESDCGCRGDGACGDKSDSGKKSPDDERPSHGDGAAAGTTRL